jgi:hypothetical protein
LPIVILIFWIGIYPSTFFKPMEKTIESLLTTVDAAKERAELPPPEGSEFTTSTANNIDAEGD